MKIDMSKCVQCGSCYTVYPELVDEKQNIIKDNMNKEEKKWLIGMCPVWAIIDE